MFSNIKELPIQVQDKAQQTDRYLQSVMMALIPLLQSYGFEAPFSQTFFIAELDTNQQKDTRLESWHLHWFFIINQFDEGKLITDERTERWFLNDYSPKSCSMLSYHLKLQLAIEKIGGHNVSASAGAPSARWHLAGNGAWSNNGVGDSSEKFMLHASYSICNLNREQFSRITLACLQILKENGVLQRAGKLHYLVPTTDVS
jgi:hypothetical protein